MPDLRRADLFLHLTEPIDITALVLYYLKSDFLTADEVSRKRLRFSSVFASGSIPLDVAGIDDCSHRSGPESPPLTWGARLGAPGESDPYCQSTGNGGGLKMSEVLTHVVHVLSSIDELAQRFDRRLTRLFLDADTDAESSVLHHVRMGYHNGDEPPITSGSSAESGAFEVLARTVQETAIASFRINFPFAGRNDLCDEPTGSNTTRNPFVLFERANSWDLNVFTFHSDEMTQVLTEATRVDEIAEALKEARQDVSIVVSWTESLIEAPGIFADVAAEYEIYLHAVREEAEKQVAASATQHYESSSDK